MTQPRLVLASGSTYRARVLASAGITIEIDPADIDERALDANFDPFAPEQHAVDLARAKAEAVATSYSDAIVIGCDQLAVLGEGPESVILHQQPTPEGAIRQLVAMSGKSHRLINGLVLINTNTGVVRAGTETITVRMRAYGEELARSYVERFSPFDTGGSYRIEDEEFMEPGDRLLDSIDCADHSGVKGMPLGLLRSLLDRI